MMNSLRMALLTVSTLLLTFPAYAQEVTKEQIKGLDEQIQ